MPNRRRNKQRLPRRRRGQRSRISSQQSATHKGLMPWTMALNTVPLFPAHRRVRSQLYFDTNLSITMPGTGVAGGYVFVANGIYDPDATGSGHQPMGFDQMMLYYEQYTVLSSSITITPLTSNQPCRVGVYLSPDGSVLTGTSQLVENGLVTSSAFGGLTSSSTAMVKIPTISLHCDVARYFGRPRSREIVNDVTLSGTVSANPTEGVYYVVTAWQSNYDGSTSKTAIFDVLLSFDVVYWEPKKVAIS